jgi:probable phosphoglycerate mutase
MQVLYFVRHGESQDNLDRVWSRHDTPLTEHGRKQARTAGRLLKKQGIQFDLIVSSPLRRARDTALIIAKELAYPSTKIQLLDLLVERDHGELIGTSGLTISDKPFTRLDLEEVSTAEKMAELHQRAEQALMSLRATGASSVLMISHGTFGRALRRVINNEAPELEFDPKKYWRLDNGEVVRFI